MADQLVFCAVSFVWSVVVALYIFWNFGDGSGIIPVMFIGLVGLAGLAHHENGDRQDGSR